MTVEQHKVICRYMGHIAEIVKSWAVVYLGSWERVLLQREPGVTFDPSSRWKTRNQG